MKVTRGELKQIINEELEAQILRENIISDLVDQIKDSGEDAAKWVKKNAKKVAKAAKSIGSDIGSVVDDVMYKVDKVAGTGMSKQARQRKAIAKWSRDHDAKVADQEAAHAAANTPEAIAARRKQREEDERAEREREADAASSARLAKADRDREKERELKDKELKKKIGRGAPRGGRRMNMDTFGGAKFESIDRDELKKIVQEELAKVLQGK